MGYAAHVRKPTIVETYGLLPFGKGNASGTGLQFDSCLSEMLHCLPWQTSTDHGANFDGAARELKYLVKFLKQQQVQEAVSYSNGSSFQDMHHTCGKRLSRV